MKHTAHPFAYRGPAFAPIAVALQLASLLPSPARAVQDRRGDAPQSAADLREVVVDTGPGVLRLSVRTAAAYDFANTQVLIDTDRDVATGFAALGIGADVLVEGGNLLRFNGENAQAWAWERIGAVTRKVEGDRLVLTLRGEAIGASGGRLVVRTLSPDYATTLDVAPDRGAIRFDIPEAVEGTESEGDGPLAAHDIVEATMTQVGSTLRWRVRAAAADDFATMLLFIDTDRNADTGFRPPADPRFGFELMLNGTTLMRHSGESRDAWAWSAVGTVGRSLEDQGRAVAFDVPVSTLSSALSPEAGMPEPKLWTLRWAAWQMSADWQSLDDRAPDRGLFRGVVDLSEAGEAAVVQRVEPAQPRADRDLPARERVARAESFYTYYGSGRVAELSHYDLVIAHSPQMKPEDIAALKRYGTVVVGYITVGEDDAMNVGNGLGPDGKASYYFDRDGDGKPDQNAIWKSWFANANDPAWRAKCVAAARHRVEVEGYDGVFLDTLDTAHNYAESEPGMVRLVRELREALPDGVIVLNQGLTFFDKLAPYADAVMLESFTATYDFQNQRYRMQSPSGMDWWTAHVSRHVLPVLAEHPMPVLSLEYAMPDDREAIQAAADRAASFGFLWSVSPIYLDDVYRLDVAANPSPRWREKQATPESMAITLSAASNGMPAGTRVVPSSCFGGYTVEPVVDGVTDIGGVYWAEAAWASAEDGEPAWLAFELPESARWEAVEVTWEPGHASRAVVVQVRRPVGAAGVAGGGVAGDWETVEARRVEVGPNVTRFELPAKAKATVFEALRLWQDVDGGSATRPGLMWIVEARAVPAR